MTTERIFFRLMWLIAFIIASVGCFYSIQSIIFDYLRYDTVSQSNVVFKEEMEFPQVTICQYTYEETNLINAVNLCKFNGLDITDKIENITIPMDGSEIRCIKIDLSNSTHRMKQKYFNSFASGLHLGFNSSMIDSKDTIVGYVLDNFAMPISLMPDVILEKRTWNLVYLDWTNEKRLSYPYSDCIDDFSKLEKTSDLIARTIKYNSFYQKSRCFYLCKFKFYAERYNCSYPGYYDTENSRNCINHVDADELQNNKFFNQKVCNDLCPMECETNTFKLTKEKTTLGDETIDYDIDFYVTYHNQQMTKIHQRSKTRGSDLISKLGGTLGLFIGVKILSFVDILEFILEIGYQSARKMGN